MVLACGTKLGPYEILSPLGAGGMGEVYRARDTRLERDVAVQGFAGQSVLRSVPTATDGARSEGCFETLSSSHLHAA